MARPRKGKNLVLKRVKLALFDDDPGDKAGRPTVYREWLVDELEKFDTDKHAGTVVQLAHFFGVSATTLVSWMGHHLDFRAAVFALRARADDGVVSALHLRAKGYTIPNVTIKREAVRVNAGDITGIDLDEGDDFTLPGEKVTTTSGHTHIPADIAAAKLWLVNRDPDNWSDKKVIELEGNLPWGELLKRVDDAMIEDVEYRDVTPTEEKNDG